MAGPGTADEFLELVRKSNVTEEKRLEACLQKLRAAGTLPDDPGKLAGLLVRDGVLTLFQAEQLRLGKWRRFTLGKYKVLERLGSGGMGTVFLCEHKLMRRRVAVKVLPTVRANDPASLERFYREARAVAALDHPNIVHAYDIDQDEQLHFLVMEYVDGTSLQDLVKKSGPLDVVRACHYIRQAAQGLEHAHEAGLVHRDIKPGNILVDRTGMVKLLDMGLARFFNDEDDILTKKYDESVLGTADYLAPEQAIDSHSVDIRADIYGLGATFYFLLAGRPPFGEGTVAQKLLWHQTRNPKPVTEYRPEVPAGVVAVMNKMLAKDPAQRYAMPGEVATALEPFTQAPVAPPSDAELPRLSPAVTGQAGESVPETATLQTTPSVAATPRALQKMGTGSNAPSGGSGIATPLPGSSAKQRTTPSPPPPDKGSSSSEPAVRPAPKSPTPRPAPAAPPVASPSETDLSPWEGLAADTEDPASGMDTSPVHRSSRSLTRLQDEKREQRRLWIVVAAVGFPFVLVIATLLWYFFPRSGPVTNTGRPRLIVSHEAGKPNTYATIKKALRHAQPGDVIELADELHAENLTVDVGAGKDPHDITIEAVPGKEIRWVGASQDPLQPLVRLQHAAGFHFKGNGITLDGKGQVRDLVLISMLCPALTLEDLTLKGFSRSAVAVVNGAGAAGKPIRLVNLTVQGASAGKGKEPGKPAIFLDANPDITAVPLVDFLDVVGLKADGLTSQQAVQAKENGVLGNNVSIAGGNP